MRVLIAPQEFKGSLGAEEAANSIAAGIRRARRGWRLDVLPLSDGGPGFIDAVRRAVPSDSYGLAVHDAMGRLVLGRWVVVRGSGDAVIEAAQANGLMHIEPEARDALAADSAGVGEILAAATESKPPRLIIGVGGSATTDGGAGMARALGARLLDAEGRELGPGGGPLRGLARIEWTRPPAFEGVEVVVATDVTNPLVGPNGAAAVYAPQKGATPEQVEVLEAGLRRFAGVVREGLGVAVAETAGAGAAGGLAAGLVAFLGARIVSGFDVVAEATGLGRRLAEADVVITGEGSFDSQSLQGKTTGRLLALAREAGKRCVVFAGRAEVRVGEVHTLAEVEPDTAVCLARARPLLEELAARWATGWSDGAL